MPIHHFAANIIPEMIRNDPTERIKLIDVVNMLNQENKEGTYGFGTPISINVRRQMKAGKMYS